MTLGVMMIIASKEPVKHYMFVWFVVWSSIVHGGIMAYQAIIDEHEMGHFGRYTRIIYFSNISWLYS